MKSFDSLPAFVLAIAFAASPGGRLAAQTTPTDFHEHTGLQLWSLRVQLG